VNHLIRSQEFDKVLREVAMYREAHRILDEEEMRRHIASESRQESGRIFKWIIFLVALLILVNHSHGAERSYPNTIEQRKEARQEDRFLQQQKWQWEQQNQYNWKNSIPYIGK
jgi:hypothetical protein